MTDTILYVSVLCSDATEQKILKAAPREIGIQIQKYHRLLAKGFANAGLKTVALSYHRAMANLENFPTEEEENGIRYLYIKASKQKFFSHAAVVFRSFLRSFSFLWKNKNAAVVCDVLNLSVSFGALLAARLLHREVVGIVTDFPEMATSGNDRKGAYWQLIRHCTSYLLLTEAMTERVRPKKKKYIVLEGHVDIEMQSTLPELLQKREGFQCLYAGGLHRKYGIETLVKAFILADIPSSVLHIYGDGDYAEELKAIRDPRIFYHGIVPNTEVVAAELCSSLLINPRPTDEEFTKYSFPSKNMEYMASGTPLLTTKLPGMPEEYVPYVYLFDDESIGGMAATLREIAGLPREMLAQKGLEARNFVLREKNNAVQARKVWQMLNNR